MASARNDTFAQEQAYGPSSKPAPNSHVVSELEKSVACEPPEGLTSYDTVPTEQATPASSDSDTTSTSRGTESYFSASTQTTTPEKDRRNSQGSSATTDTTHIGFGTTMEATSQESLQKPEPEPGLSPLKNRNSRRSLLLLGLLYPDPIAAEEWYMSLCRFEQLEYLVIVKIETFRQHLGVRVPTYSRQCYIDWEEEDRRRNFYMKNGEEAYCSRYVNSDYTGHVEFLYVEDPKDLGVYWQRMGGLGF